MSATAGRRRATRWPISVFALAACLVVAFGPLPASAGAAATSLTLVAQDPWTVVGDTLHATLAVDGAPAGSSISVVAHQALASRSAFDRTISDNSLGSVVDQVVVPLDALPTDANGNRALNLGLEVTGGPRLAELLGARRSGVYPLEIELRDANDETLAGFVTYLTAVPPIGSEVAVTSPLGVAWIWPLQAAPSLLPGDGPDPAVVAQLEPDGRIGRQVAALGRANGVPITVVPGPETVQTWDAVAKGAPELADGADALRTASQAHQMIAGSYVAVDLPSLLGAGMTSAVDAELVEGNEALRRFFGTRLDATTAVARPIDNTTLGRLLSGTVDRVVIDSNALVPSSSRLSVAQPFVLSRPATLTAGGPVSAIAADASLTSLLTSEGPPALQAQRLLAGLSVVALEEPDDARAVAILNPADFAPSDALIDAVLTGLRSNPWLRPMTVDQAFDATPAGTTDDGSPVMRELAPYSPPAPLVTPAAYDTARVRLATLHEFAPDTPGLALADHALLSSVSSAWYAQGGAERAAAELASIDGTISGLVGKIHVPNRSTITLTDRSGDIPLTFRNDTKQTVDVLVELQSQKLSFPDGVQRIITLPPKNTTVRFAVEARTSGSFPLRVTIRSSNGVLPIAETEFEVKATAVSAVGLVLIVSALGFLILWWVVHIRRDRRRRVVAPQGAAA